MGNHQLRNLFILLVIMGAFDVYRYFTTGIVVSDLIYKYIFVIGVFLITCFIVYVISRRNEWNKFNIYKNITIFLQVINKLFIKFVWKQM